MFIPYGTPILIMLTNRLAITLLVLGIAAVLLPSAWASSVSLTPGGITVTPGNNTGTFNPNTGAAGYTEMYQTSGLFNVNVTAVEDVYLHNGQLDFFIQFYNTGSDAIQAVDLTSFAGYQTSVGYISLAPTEKNPTGADLSNAGDVTFHYLSGTQGTLTGTSDWLEIDTNATSATLAGTLGFIGDDGQKFYEPTPTPEPATTGVVAAALALMALVARRRLPKKI